MGDREARVRDEAYRIWVDAGRPAGNDQRYWYEAEKRVAADAPKAANAPKDAKEASPEQMPDTGAAKAAGAKRPAGAAKAANPKPSEAEAEGSAAAPAPGPAGAKPKAVRSVAKNAGNGGVAAPARLALKGEGVEIAPKAPIRAPRKAATSAKKPKA